MSFKNTLILSMLLHLCFFAATLLLSTNLLVGSSKMPDEKVFFVKLTVGIDSYREDIVKSGIVQSVVETKKPKPKKPLQIKTEKKSIILGIDSYRDVRRKAVSVETDVASKNNNYLNTQEEPVNNILLADYKTGEDDVIDIPYGQETAVNVSYNSSSSGNGEVSEGKGRGILPVEIIELIRNSIENVKTYPLLARKRGIEGTVYISFRISPQGKPQDLKILKSSGSSIIDTATLDIVKKAAPFPYVDSPIEVPIVFRLKN